MYISQIHQKFSDMRVVSLLVILFWQEVHHHFHVFSSWASTLFKPDPVGHWMERKWQRAHLGVVNIKQEEECKGHSLNCFFLQNSCLEFACMRGRVQIASLLAKRAHFQQFTCITLSHLLSQCKSRIINFSPKYYFLFCKVFFQL